ncbi:helix-turn-helix domain-containing protein [Comamonas sp. 4034]|uniref:helix-turn-helix domain-containing protein n=1 Tax=Comamonas sp. 4034 TaxID=3156455 RepID=UPI003D1DA7ED
MRTDPKTQAVEPGVDGSSRDLPNSVTLALGQSVKRHRHAAKLSQMNLAFEAEMERSHVSRIERGVSNPSLFALATICHVLKITLPELFEGITDTIAPTAQGGPVRRKNQSVLEKAPPPPSRKMPLR